MSRTDELRQLMLQIPISQRKAAAYLEVDDRTMRYWCSANPEPPVMAIYALRYLLLNNTSTIADWPQNLTPDPITDEMVPPLI